MNLLYSAAEATISGANKSMCIVAESIKKRGNNVYIILPEHGDIEKELEERDLQYFIIKSHTWTESNKENRKSQYIKNILKKYKNLIAILKIKNLIKKYNIDIVHNNSSSSYVAIEAAHKLGIKTIWHFREFLEEDHGIKISKEFKSEKIINSCSLGIAISKSVLNKFTKLYKDIKIEMIYNGIKVEDFYNEKQILKLDKINICIIGRVSPGKGQKELVQAVEILNKEKYGKFKINIVGDDSYQYANELKQYVKEHKLEEIVQFIKPTKEITKLYADTDIIVVASRNEAFGRVTVEGMLSSCLVIGANTAGTKEIIQDMVTGILYKQGSINDLAEKIKLACNNKEKSNEIIENAREYAKQNFNSQKNVENIYSLYKRLIKEGGNNNV